MASVLLVRYSATWALTEHDTEGLHRKSQRKPRLSQKKSKNANFKEVKCVFKEMKKPMVRLERLDWRMRCPLGQLSCGCGEVGVDDAVHGRLRYWCCSSCARLLGGRGLQCRQDGGQSQRRMDLGILQLDLGALRRNTNGQCGAGASRRMMRRHWPVKKLGSHRCRRNFCIAYPSMSLKFPACCCPCGATVVESGLVGVGVGGDGCPLRPRTTDRWSSWWPQYWVNLIPSTQSEFIRTMG